MNASKTKIFATLVIIIVLIFGSVFFLFQKDKLFGTKKRPYDNAITLVNGELIQRGFEKDCQQAFNEIGNNLLDFETRAFSNGEELFKVSSSASIRQEKVSQDTMEFVKKGYEYCVQEQGYYDITVGALRSLWGFSSNTKNVPTDEQISNLISSVGFKQISFNDEKSAIGLNNMGAKLDFSGYQQGYVIDKAIEQSKELGLKTAFVAYGDNFSAYGQRPDDATYAVSIKNPDNDQETIGNLKFSEGGISSCGINTNSFSISNDEYWDVLDLKTGKPANNGLKSITVQASNGAQSSILARSLFVRGIDYVKEHLEDYNIIAIDDNGDMLISSSIKSNFETD